MGRKHRTSKFVQQSRFNISNIPYKSLSKQLKEYQRMERRANKKYAEYMMKISEKMKKEGYTDTKRTQEMFKENLEKALGTSRFDNPEDNKRFDDMIRETLKDLENSTSYAPLYSMNITLEDISNDAYFSQSKYTAIKKFRDYCTYNKYKITDETPEEDKDSLTQSLEFRINTVDRYEEFMNKNSNELTCRYFELAFYLYILNNDLENNFYFVSTIFLNISKIISNPSDDYNSTTIKNMNNIIQAYIDMNDESKVVES